MIHRTKFLGKVRNNVKAVSGNIRRLDRTFLLLTGLLGSVYCTKAGAQETTPLLTTDFPSHNQLMFNRFLINPTFSLVRENKSYLNFFHRNQNAHFEDNRKDFFVGFTKKAGENMGLGLNLHGRWKGVLQNFGVHMNYSYGLKLSGNSNFTFGSNISYFSSGFNEDAAITTAPDPYLDSLEKTTLLTIQPGFNLSLGSFDVGIYSENFLDFDLKKNEMLTDFKDKTFTGHLQYTHVLENSKGILKDTRIMPLARISRKNQDFQLSGTFLLDIPALGWLQAGYNKRYGASLGFGFKLNKYLALGYVTENQNLGSNSGLSSNHEISLSYIFSQKEPHRTLLSHIDTEITPKSTLQKDKSVEKRIDPNEGPRTLASHKDTETTSKSTSKKDRSVKKEIDLNEDLGLDKAVALAKENKALIQRLTKTQDSFVRHLQKDLERRYEMVIRHVRKEMNGNAVKNSETLNPGLSKQQKETKVMDEKIKFRVIQGIKEGYYVVANVFSSKTNLVNFMIALQAQGLECGFFINRENGYYYTYISYSEDIKVARAILTTDLNGKYTEDKWILHAVNTPLVSKSNHLSSL